VSGYKPLAIDLSTEDALPAEFAADAAALFKNEDRVEIEPSATGFILYAVWERDAENAIEQLSKALGFRIEIGAPRVLYREESRLLEPIMQISVFVPEDCVGEVMGDLNRRRGMIQGSGSDGDNLCKIHGLVPLANTFGYLFALLQMTKGKGKVHIDFHGYEHVPPYEPDPDPSQPSAAALRGRRTA
jgi:translation elongation factor EF-G